MYSKGTSVSIQSYTPDTLKNGKNYITTGTLARLTGISRETLTFYIRSGLIQPAFVAENNYKYFLPEQIQTINFIRFYRKMGFSLETIQEKLEIYHNGNSSPDLNDMLAEQKRMLESHIQSMQISLQFVEWEQHLLQYLHSRETDMPFIDELPERTFYLTPVPFRESLNDADNAGKLAAFFKDSNGGFQVPRYPLCCRIRDELFLSATVRKHADSSSGGTESIDPVSGRAVFRRKAGRYGCMIHSGDATHLPKAINQLIQWLADQDIPLTGIGFVVNSCDFVNITENQKTLFLIMAELSE